MRRAAWAPKPRGERVRALRATHGLSTRAGSAFWRNEPTLPKRNTGRSGLAIQVTVQGAMVATVYPWPLRQLSHAKDRLRPSRIPPADGGDR